MSIAISEKDVKYLFNRLVETQCSKYHTTLKEIVFKQQLFEAYYDYLIDNNFFGMYYTVRANEIVDKDFISCIIITPEHMDYKKIKKLYSQKGCRCDISRYKFECCGKYGFSSIEFEYQNCFLVRQ